jgi:uncharacterized pyridoxamine 5'-phosphate oxidase family protein
MAKFFFGRRVQRLKHYAGFLLILASLFVCTKNEVSAQTNHLETEDMNVFVKILQEHPYGVLANRNGRMIRTQIMTFRFAEGNRVYFETNSLKPVYKQLRRYPYVSYCTYAEEFEPVLSINGKVVFVEDPALKSRLFNENINLKSKYQSPENPNFKVFYIDTEEIETFGAAGVKIYKTK